MLRHVAMVAKPKFDLKSKFALFQTSSILFIEFAKCWQNFLGLNPKGSYPSLEIRVLFTYSVKRTGEIRKFHVAVMQRWLKNVQKSMMHDVQSCFINVNLLLFLPFLLPSLLPIKLPFFVIQKFCFHGNMTSHFSLLLGE